MYMDKCIYIYIYKHESYGNSPAQVGVVPNFQGFGIVATKARHSPYNFFSVDLISRKHQKALHFKSIWGVCGGAATF